MVAAIAILALAGYSFYAKQRRREDVSALALRHGFNFDEGDPRAMLDCDLPLFTLGDDRGIENTVWGRWKDLDVSAADYWYYTESTDSKGTRRRSYRRFSVAMMTLPAWLPTLTIQPESIFSWLADKAGFHDIDFESEEFNARFQVSSENRKFAFEFVDARIMRWLLSVDPRYGIQMRGNNIIIFAKTLRPTELFSLIGTAKELHDRIPDLVWEEYGTGRGAARA
ncbi:MAG: hypothetical protein QOH90_953 [Actinomycetota bacterium]|nr:hypothetical protein [Actinomycetota bacterium]